MKSLNFARRNGEKVMKELQSYIDGLIKRNEELEDKLATYNKEEEIQKLKDENQKLRTNSLHIMSENERRDAKSFAEEHYRTCESNIEYILVGTGIGTAISVKCRKCQSEKSVTDMTNW